MRDARKSLIHAFGIMFQISLIRDARKMLRHIYSGNECSDLPAHPRSPTIAIVTRLHSLWNRNVRQRTFWYMRTTKYKITLQITRSLIRVFFVRMKHLCIPWVSKIPPPRLPSKDSDQTARTCLKLRCWRCGSKDPIWYIGKQKKNNLGQVRIYESRTLFRCWYSVRALCSQCWSFATLEAHFTT